MSTELRVGDAERDAVAAALHEHFAQGRLTREELDERLTATLSAKTVGDLRAVTRDLPAPPGERGPFEPGAAHRGRGPLVPATGHPWPRHGRGPHARGPHAWGPYGLGPYGLGPRGWGPPGRRPFGPLLLVALVVAAFTGWWVIFPVLFCVWFAAAFTILRFARRR
jgi:hypothetical protein